MYASLFRLVYMLQSCPMDDAVRLLKPILSAETWVSNKINGVKIGQSVQRKWLMSVFGLPPAASQHFWASSDLLPSNSSAALSRPPR